MNTPTKKKLKSLLEQADTIGIKGIENLPNESKRLEEIKRLGILEADLSEIQVFNNIINCVPISLDQVSASSIFLAPASSNAKLLWIK